MTSYKYEVRTAEGQTTTGVIQAQSLPEASAIAKGYGSYVLNVMPVSGMAGAEGILAKMREVKIELGPGLKDVLNFTKQLGVMIKAGINIRSAIGGISEQVENPKFKKILLQIKADVESGKPFSEAIAEHPKVFSPLYVNMIRASELSGNFGHMLDRISKYLAQQVETRSMVRGAMIYPMIIAVMAVGATVFLLTFVLPKFTMLFSGKEALLPKPTVMLMAMSDFIRAYWYVIVAGLVASFVGLFYAIKTDAGSECWDRLKLKIPLFKRMLRALYITRSLHTMGELVSAGVPMLETLDITGEVSGHFQYRKMWADVHDAVEQGSKIVQPLGRQKLLPSNVVQMISAGEESGNLGPVMRDIADFYSQELKATIKAVTAMIEPLMIVLMGCVVGFIAMSIILPIFKMSKLVQ